MKEGKSLFQIFSFVLLPNHENNLEVNGLPDHPSIKGRYWVSSPLTIILCDIEIK
jgi:hypothetical protein